MLNWKIRSPHTLGSSEKNYQHAVNVYQQTLSSPEIGFFSLPQNTELLTDAKKVYGTFLQKKYFIHVGIGGSALGPDMLLKALAHQNGVEFIFLNNIDPDEFALQLSKINIKEALIYIVSKSGTTAETVAAMSILAQKLLDAGIQENQFKDYFVFCTDPVKGDLRKIAQEWNVQTLSVPSNVGGRFSVLTPVGFLPALFAGLDVEKLLKGAQDIQKYLHDPVAGKNFYELGLWLKELHEKGIHQTVMMPYSSKLKEFSSWFVQLWAESLGKQGKGLTPIPAYGATDQHSQMQLFMEGPSDKVLFLVEVQKFAHDYPLKNKISGESFRQLAPYTLGQLMKAELEGTLEALKENQRHVVHLQIPALKEEYLGQLIIFAECLTVLVGKLMDIDPFNQPGVEAGKKYAYAWLKTLGK